MVAIRLTFSSGLTIPEYCQNWKAFWLSKPRWWGPLVWPRTLLVYYFLMDYWDCKQLRTPGIFGNAWSLIKFLKTDISSSALSQIFYYWYYKRHFRKCPISAIACDIFKRKRTFVWFVKELHFNHRSSIDFRNTFQLRNFIPVEDLPKHAHLQFHTKDKSSVLSFVDYRRFGSWKINGDWGADRGPDPVTQYQVSLVGCSIESVHISYCDVIYSCS